MGDKQRALWHVMAFLEWSIARLVCLGDANALLLAIRNNIIMGAVRRVTFFWGGGGWVEWERAQGHIVVTSGGVSGICLLIFLIFYFQQPQFYKLPHPNFYSLKTFEKSLNSQTLIKSMTLTLLSHSVLNETRVEKGKHINLFVC